MNGKSALYALGKEFWKVFGLSPGELIQRMIGCLSKESFRKKEINSQSTSCEDGANLAANILPHNRPPADRLMLSASENNLSLPLGNDAKVSFSKRAGKTMKHREQDFHQQLFELLNDGAKLSYYSHGKEILEGYKFGKNILCSCCNSMLSASKFEAHAGHEKRRKPYHSIYTSYGKSLHQIAVFLSLDKGSFDPVDKDLIMGSKVGGKLPFDLRYQNACNAGEQSSSACSSFSFGFGRIFQAPCNLGSCMFCRNDDATLNYGNICDTTMLFCGQCGRMFHVGCLRIHGICDIKERPNPPDSWLCGDKCIKVRADLLNFFQEGPRNISESLLTSLPFSIRSTLHKETKIHVHWQLLSGRFQDGKSELLQQATQIFQEAFGAVYKGYRDVLSTMVNGEKGVAEFFGGMFCAVITVKSRIVSAALLRVFGNHVAELPLAATAKERRGEGFFKILLLKIEEMLSFMKVEKLILPADIHSLPMWVENFGFINMSIEEIREYQMEHRIMMFENTSMLQKAVLQS
ncbi:increased DNA methylation 1-like [Phalaenopsis equestris]|uniref:increased DNA methylation 1-like n=1 Tax=Phalaenopsis equestris TaxID=78828 RepID=UPI0009E2DA8C|nr:increased DNA methylation 1-like [Phalaenopsis equestris]